MVEPRSLYGPLKDSSEKYNCFSYTYDILLMYISDEIDCEIVKTDASYLKDVSPPPVDNKSKSGVTIGIEVQSILEINEVDFLISLQLRVSLTWLDKRLTMLDLRNDSSVNTLTEDFKRKIWLPQVHQHFPQ